MKIPAFKLERYFARYEFNIEHLLCASDCESLAIQDLLALEPDADQWISDSRSRFREAPLTHEIAIESLEIVHEGFQDADAVTYNDL